MKDIVGRRIAALDPATLEHRVWPLEGRPTSLALWADGGALVGTQRHICRRDWEGEPEPLVEVEPDLPSSRPNEDAVGPDGAFRVGRMHQNIRDGDGPTAYAPDGRPARVSEDRFGIANTLVWPLPDRLVTADTLANAPYAYRVDPEGRLSDREVLPAGSGRGLPDGSGVDAAGFVWTARVAGGGCLTRAAPDGRIDRVVELPCSSPTRCAFGARGCGPSSSPRRASG